MDVVNILIVEDNTTVAEDARECLEGLGYSVTAIAASGEEAVESAGRDRPDAVLMDIKLRGPMDGVEAADRIHAEFDIPVLFLSAYSDRDLLGRAKRTGSFGYLVKPFEERELHAMLEMTLYNARVEKERRRMSEKLRESEAKLKQYSENLEALVAERTRELEKAQEELLAKERLALLGHFSGSVAHEIGNPLAAIDSAIYLLNMKLGGDEKVSEILERITKNSKKAAAIIQGLRNLSKMKKPFAKPHDVSDLIRESIHTCRVPHSITVETEFPDNKLFVNADFEQVRMALKNLINNAIQAMNETGKLTVSVTPLDTGHVEIAVADTGPGISPEDLEKIFEPLFTTKTHGMGFGLSITRMIIENHGGRIRAESEPGNGARFIMAMPEDRSPDQPFKAGKPG